MNICVFLRTKTHVSSVMIETGNFISNITQLKNSSVLGKYLCIWLSGICKKNNSGIDKNDIKKYFLHIKI